MADLQFIGYDEFARTSKGKRTILDIARLLLTESDLELGYDVYSACKETFTLWQQLNVPWYYELPLQERVCMAIGVALHHVWDRKSEVFRAALTSDVFPTSAVSMTNSEGRTLLHAVAANIGTCRRFDRVKDKPDYGLITGACHVPTMGLLLTKV